MRARKLALTVTTVLVTTLAAGCSSSSKPSSDASTQAGPVTLSFWSWVPNMDKIVDVWNRAHPNIKVVFSKQSSGDEEATKLLTAAKAGNPPDVAQVEYQMLPTMVANNVLADIKNDVADVKADFSDGLWNLVTLGSDSVYALPQDSGPMMLYYRQDLFKKYGLTLPKTWDEFATLAETVKKKAPGHYLTNFSAQDPGWFAGLVQQAGAQWWSTSGDAWKVNIADDPSKKVASFWGKLVNDGSIDSKPSYTPEWNKKLNDGTLLAWPSAIWAPGVLTGSAPDAKGKWAMAALPQWNAGESVTGFWGGSSSGITAKSKHQKEAAQFIKWLNDDPQGVDLLVKQGSDYPASTKGQSALATAPDYFSNQPTFYQDAAKIAAGARGFVFGPDVNATYNAYKDAFGKVIQSKGDFTTALSSMQSATVADLQKSGFKVG